MLPSEFNLSPLYRHRLEEDGTVLEMDVLWPIIHYEQTPTGGSDFRIRPLWRWITEGERDEHQFLWPLGRVVSDPEENRSRVFPLWYRASRLDENGQRDIDWYFIFPIFWGGWHEAGDENYFAVIPIYADIPEFLVYDRFKMYLWPLYTKTEKNGHNHNIVLWPFIAWGSCDEAGNHEWFRVWPLYARDAKPGHWERTWLLWPFFSWGTENMFSDDPVSTFWFWPFWGRQTSRAVDSWTVLWPFFQKNRKEDHFYKLDILWPFFRYQEDRANRNLVQWWLWPFVGHTVSDVQRAWSVLWPILWFREYDDPEGTQIQDWVLPFFWHYNRDYNDGREDDYWKIWPLAHRKASWDADGNKVRGRWSIFSAFPWSENNANGFEEMYGWIWTVVKGTQRAVDDDAVELAINLFTRRTRAGRTQSSMPLLFNYEGDDSGGTLRLLQFIPIPWGAPAGDANGATGDNGKDDER